MNDIMDNFSLRFRERRHALGMTQRELAEKIGYSEKAISKWESGTALPPSILLPRLSEILDISIDILMSKPTEIRYYLGIDGGGTKTEFVLADQSGTVLRQKRLGASNPNDIGIKAAIDVLDEGILEICDGLSKREISVFAGIAGGTTGDHPDRIADALARHRFGKAANGSDAQNAVAASLGKKNGVTVIMGTGAIAFAQSEGSLYRVGGFGYLFGDGGSGFAIGRDGILAALKDEAGYGERTLLTQLVKEKCGGNSILERLSDFYKEGKRTVASYAPLVFEALDAGDDIAERIVRENMEEIAELIRAAARHLDDKNGIRAVLCGGLTHCHSRILPIIREALGLRPESYTIEICTKSTVYGALLLAGMEETNNAENRDEK